MLWCCNIFLSQQQQIRTSGRSRNPVNFSDFERDNKASTAQLTESFRKRGRPIQSSCQVDITSLLGLPQRQAAQVIGISESMLCKRYKEQTMRKWPYRYLGKIEKRIAAKEALAQEGMLSTEDQATLNDLIQE